MVLLAKTDFVNEVKDIADCFFIKVRSYWEVSRFQADCIGVGHPSNLLNNLECRRFLIDRHVPFVAYIFDTRN
jgi:hypothetical protein